MNKPAKKHIVAVFSFAIIATVVATVVVMFCWPKGAIENRNVDSVEPVEHAQDVLFRELFIGTWQDDFQGRRTLTVRADGTATMVVELDGLNSLFASRLTFREVWSIAGGQLRMEAIGGEPETRVSMILKTMGNVSVQKILELTKDRLFLLDANGKTEYDWRRLD